MNSSPRFSSTTASTADAADAADAPVPIGEVAGLVRMWDFRPMLPLRPVMFKRAWASSRYKRPRPQHSEIKPLGRSDLWVVYFAYCPDERFETHQRFTLERLKDSGFKVLVICATRSPAAVPMEIDKYADALYWKDLPGYDFSAYTLALELVSTHSPGATVMILNDSVFGPFADLRPFVAAARWDLTGFTASSLEENHVQSYAFLFHGMDPTRLEALRAVFYKDWAYSHGDGAVYCQETRMARIASRSMSVGAFYYSDGKTIDDPCLRRPFELLDAGFPFLKRSLLGRMHMFQNPDRVREALLTYNHPLQISSPR